MYAVSALFLATLVACKPEDSDTSEEVLDALLAAPHDCALEEAVAVPGEDLGDCYRRTVWHPECEYGTPELDTGPIVAVISTYNRGSASPVMITDQATLEAYVESIAFTPVEVPSVDFTTNVVAAIYHNYASCNGNTVQTGVVHAFYPIIYYRFHDVTGSCNVRCDARAEVAYLYAISRAQGFPQFCIDQLDSCEEE